MCNPRMKFFSLLRTIVHYVEIILQAKMSSLIKNTTFTKKPSIFRLEDNHQSCSVEEFKKLHSFTQKKKHHPMSKIAPNITHLIGKTPLLKIPSLSELTGCEILLKCENTNPGRSIKDRAALQLVLDAIEQKKLKPGMTIVEGTGGNTGIGLVRALGVY